MARPSRRSIVAAAAAAWAAPSLARAAGPEYRGWTRSNATGALPLDVHVDTGAGATTLGAWLGGRPAVLALWATWSGKVGEEWALNAGRIDAMLAPLTEAALESAAFRPGERVLDIGCGAGATSIEIARRAGERGSVVGVDLSPQLLALARSRAGQAGLAVEFVEADAGSAQLGASFDAAFSRFGVMFFEAPAQAFAHIRAGMCAGGRLIFACWRPLAENIWTTIPLEAIAPMLKTPLAPPDPDAPGPYALAEPAKIKRIRHDAGWRDIVLSPWDGCVAIAGGGSLEDAAEFLLRIGPCARAIADQQLDPAEAKRRVIERLSPLYAGNAVTLPVACWLVTAKA